MMREEVASGIAEAIPVIVAKVVEAVRGEPSA